MVCRRCKMIVIGQLSLLGIPYLHVDIGEVYIRANVSAVQCERLGQSLAGYGFFLLDDKKASLVGSLKEIIIELVHSSEEPPAVNFSHFISEKLKVDYHFIAKLFSSVFGVTLEQFLISQRIERVKEFLVYERISLTEIAYQMHYSSVAHLSNQFKKVTGLTPSEYKKSHPSRWRDT